MPIINRPRTDTERQQALGVAKAKADAVTTAGGTLAFSTPTRSRLDIFLPSFVTEISERGSALTAQAAASAAIDPERDELRTHISHFFQVFNLGVARGVYPASDRGHYQLAVSSERVPDLASDVDLVQWANNIKIGDAARIAAGGAPMANPTAAEVDAKLTVLLPLLQQLTTTKDTYDTEQEDVAALRPEADDIIADVWDEVLFTYRKDEAPSMRRKAREYGVVYRLSKGEAPNPAEYSLQGTATDKATSLPLLDVEATIATTTQTTLTDANGHYLIGIVPDGTYTIQFRKAGYQDVDIADVVITAGVIGVVDVEMVEA